MNITFDEEYARGLLEEIANGQTWFVARSASSADAMLLDEPDNTMTNDQADKLKWHLDRLERMGRISIERRSTDGTYSGVKCRR